MKRNIRLLILLTTMLGLLRPLCAEDKNGLIPDLSVTGIIKTQNYFEALINENIVKKGDTIKGARVIDITPSEVKFEFQGTTIIRKIGEGVVRRVSPIFSEPTVNKDMLPATLATSSPQVDSYAQSLYEETKDYYKKAQNREELYDKLNAFRNYRKAIEVAQSAIPRIKNEQQKELNKIIEESQKRMNELLEEEKVVESLRSFNLRTPEKITEWMQKNITYQSDWSLHKKKDYWQAPQETILLKAGDCEDAAFLIQALLNEINISSTVISVGFIDENSRKLGHAMCVFPAQNPRNYFTNAYLYKSKEAVDASFILKLYPGCYYIDILDLYNKSRTKLYKQR